MCFSAPVLGVLLCVRFYLWPISFVLSSSWHRCVWVLTSALLQTLLSCAGLHFCDNLLPVCIPYSMRCLACACPCLSWLKSPLRHFLRSRLPITCVQRFLAPCVNTRSVFVRGGCLLACQLCVCVLVRSTGSCRIHPCAGVLIHARAGACCVVLCCAGQCTRGGAVNSLQSHHMLCLP